MVNRYYTFAELLARLKYNVSSTVLPESGIAGITQIRKIVSKVTQVATLSRTNTGPSYFTYPVWNTADLQSYWTLASPEVVTGTDGVRDSIGTQHGTIGGTVTPSTFDDTSIGRVRRFSVGAGDAVPGFGASDFIDVGNITALDGATLMSWGMKIRMDTDYRDQAVTNFPIGHWSTVDGDKQFAVEIPGNTGRFDVAFATDAVGGTAFGRTASDTILPNTWHSIVITYNGGGAANADRLKVYLDTVSQSLNFTGTIPTSLQTVTSNVFLGHRTNQSERFYGELGDVSYWNVELSSADITTWHNDAITDRIITNFWKVPGTLVTNIIPTTHISPWPNPRRKHVREGYVVRRQITG